MSGVLITGGTGYIASAIANRLHKEGEQRICLLSRDEFKQSELKRTAPYGQEARWMLGCVRDKERVRRAAHGCRLIIHTAALKRIETAVGNPSELVKTNIIGTQNVCEVAEEMCIPCVFVSTDKACQPVSVYGQSKALAEQIALRSGAVVVRFGNVAGSTGSIIPKWRSMGGVVPVTDPGATRFWMWADEAVDLVLNAAQAWGKTEAAFIQIPPDLPAYSVGDLAKAMDKEFDILGIPPWEKMHESLIPGVVSDKARRMTVEELRDALQRL